MNAPPPPPDRYRIVKIETGEANEQEAMGSKPKFWYRPLDRGAPWLFKYPQAATGQHWAEKIAAEIASCLHIPHAVVELAEVGGSRGSISESFARGGRQLIHGNEILAAFMAYDPDKKFGQSAHTLDNILHCFDKAFRSHIAAERAKQRFAAYVVLDALIGNTDRHHENWGLLAKRTKSGVRGFLAPTFDHASSLGRELRDEKRQARLREGTIGQYSERGRGGIFWGAEGRHGPSPLELVRQAVRKYPELFRPPILRVCEHGDDLEDAIRRVPECWMSKTAKDFAAALIRYNASGIKQCLK